MASDEVLAAQLEKQMQGILELKCGCEGSYIAHNSLADIGVRITRTYWHCEQWNRHPVGRDYWFHAQQFQLSREELWPLLERLRDANR